jgi:hypothetical protein
MPVFQAELETLELQTKRSMKATEITSELINQLIPFTTKVSMAKCQVSNKTKL